MTSRYRLSHPAKRDLQAIADYRAAEAGTETGVRVLTGLIETIVALSGQPRAGRTAEEFGEQVRKFLSRNYVLHVFHVARDQREAWSVNR